MSSMGLGISQATWKPRSIQGARTMAAKERHGSRLCEPSPNNRRTKAFGGGARGVLCIRNVAAEDEMFAVERDESAYLALGVCQVYRKDEEGKLTEVQIIEPINPSTLECMNIGAATSFKFVTGVTLEDVSGEDKSYLPEEYHQAEFCEDFSVRTETCARTWNRPYPQESLMDIVPLGAKKSDWNFSVTHKRVLNEVHVVNDDDNIKQDKSIDVYGRFDDEEEK